MNGTELIIGNKQKFFLWLIYHTGDQAAEHLLRLISWLEQFRCQKDQQLLQDDIIKLFCNLWDGLNTCSFISLCNYKVMMLHGDGSVQFGDVGRMTDRREFR